LKEKRDPMRKCVGCNVSRPQKELIRLACADGRVFVDRDGKAPGRGVYLCPDASCVKKAKKKNALQRSFGIAIDAGKLEELLKEVEDNGKT
jgi:Predicted nucleic-acid-binding protein implicated in transcription termination